MTIPPELTLMAVALALFGLAEIVRPAREQARRLQRWVENLIFGICWILPLYTLWQFIHPWVRAAVGPISPAAFGPQILLLVLAVLLLDLFQYWTHRLLHAVPMFWAIHRTHHSDRDVDASTAIRHHPLEPLMNAPVQYALVLLSGVPLEAAAAYTVIATCQTIFAHSSLRLSPDFERALRWIVVTPGVHRIHHSIVQADVASNFGMVFPYWDQAFGTYRSTPVEGFASLQAGLPR